MIKRIIFFGTTLFLLISSKVIMYPEGKMPEIKGNTINGLIIDSAYFKQKVTLVNFMDIGCPPCMRELKLLKKLNSYYKQSEFQILCVAPNTKDQLEDFQGNNSSIYSLLRKHFKVDSIEYPILPECFVKKVRENSYTVGPECNTISSEFGVDGYPTSFLIDKNRNIRKVFAGFPNEPEDSLMFEIYRIEIENVLRN